VSLRNVTQKASSPPLPVRLFNSRASHFTLSCKEGPGGPHAIDQTHRQRPTRESTAGSRGDLLVSCRGASFCQHARLSRLCFKEISWNANESNRSSAKPNLSWSGLRRVTGKATRLHGWMFIDGSVSSIYVTYRTHSIFVNDIKGCIARELNKVNRCQPVRDWSSPTIIRDACGIDHHLEASANERSNSTNRTEDITNRFEYVRSRSCIKSPWGYLLD